MSVISLAQLTSAINSATPAPDIPEDWNGSAGTVDLSRPTDHTGEYGKVCAPGKSFNLKQTLEYLLWAVQGKQSVKVELTQEHIDAVAPHFKAMIARYRVYKLFKASGVDVKLRDSDIFNHSNIDSDAVPIRSAKELYTLFTGTQEAEAQIAKVGQMVLFSFVANGIHREQNDGHSWFSKEVANRRSPTAKTLQVAGRLRDELSDYMRVFGHDGNHHLADETLDKIAKVLCRVDMSHTVDSDVDYAGSNRKGESLHEIFSLGNAVEGRYPAGILGKASLIVGLDMYKAMIVNICTRVKVTGEQGITHNATQLADRIRSMDLPHTSLIALGQKLGPTFGVIHGFLSEAKVINEDEFLAFKNVASRYPAEQASGRSLATTLKRVSPHREALAGAIVSTLTAMSQSLVSAAAVSTGTGDLAVLTDTTIVDVTAIKAEIGGKPSGDMFYDANP
jgi:hypothetical protein